MCFCYHQSSNYSIKLFFIQFTVPYSIICPFEITYMNYLNDMWYYALCHYLNIYLSLVPQSNFDNIYFQLGLLEN